MQNFDPAVITDFFNTVKDFVITFGWAKGILTIFFFLAHYWIFRQYDGRLKDRQKEIDRLAEENAEYRNRFLDMLDERFKLEKKGDQK